MVLLLASDRCEGNLVEPQTLSSQEQVYQKVTWIHKSCGIKSMHKIYTKQFWMRGMYIRAPWETPPSSPLAADITCGQPLMALYGLPRVKLIPLNSIFRDTSLVNLLSYMAKQLYGHKLLFFFVAIFGLKAGQFLLFLNHLSSSSISGNHFVSSQTKHNGWISGKWVDIKVFVISSQFYIQSKLNLDSQLKTLLFKQPADEREINQIRFCPL